MLTSLKNTHFKSPLNEKKFKEEKSKIFYLFLIPGPEVIKLFSCSAKLSMKVFLLINVEMPTIVAISIFMSRKNSILGLSEPEKFFIS